MHADILDSCLMNSTKSIHAEKNLVLKLNSNKKLTHFDELNQVNIFENKSVSPDAVVKQIDPSFESFFH